MQIHPSQIMPSQPFDVFYFIRDHTDSTTYYVRAVVYDVQSGEVIQTVDLEQSATNPRLFIKQVVAPGDPHGYGRNIVAIATVYTDSSFTSKSQNFEEQEQYFLIRAEQTVMGGGGSFDYRYVEELIKDLFEKHLKKEEPLSPPVVEKVKPATPVKEVPVAEIMAQFKAILVAISELPQEPSDLGQFEDKLTALKEVISTVLEESEKEINTEPIEKILSSFKEEILSSVQKSYKEFSSEVIKDQKKIVEQYLSQIKKIVEPLEKALGKQMILPISLNGMPEREEKSERKGIKIPSFKSLAKS